MHTPINRPFVRRCAILTFSAFLGLCGPGAAVAQTSLATLARVSPEATPAALPFQSSSQPADSSDDLHVSIYPVLIWVPAFKATTTVPPFPDVPGGPDMPGGSGSTTASFDGALLAGLSLEKARWRLDTDGIWAALTTQRDRPLLNIDLDVIYGHVSSGVKIYKALYVTGGVRRVALDYDIQIGDRPQHFSRKPGIWDPLVGLGWHGAAGSHWVFHATAEGGGFGVGAEKDLSAAVRADLKFAKHFGLTLGYSVVYLELSNTVLERTFEIKQTLQGPVVGFGLYF